MLFLANSIMFCDQVMVLHVPVKKNIITQSQIVVSYSKIIVCPLCAARCFVGRKQKDTDGTITTVIIYTSISIDFCTVKC